MKKKDIPFVFYRYLHSKLYQKHEGRDVRKKELVSFLYRWRVPRKLRPLIIKEMEILGLIKKKRLIFELELPTIYEENINEYYDCLGMFDCGDEDYSLNNE